MVGALRVVTTKNVVHAALYLVVLAGVAAQFILLAAEFVAITQVLVYIGAIVVLFLFGIMLTRAELGAGRPRQRPAVARRRWSSPCSSRRADLRPGRRLRAPSSSSPQHHDGSAEQPDHGGRLHLPHLPRARSRSCRCSCWPP